LSEAFRIIVSFYVAEVREIMRETTPGFLPKRVKRISWLAGIAWSVIVFGLYFHDVADIRQTTVKTARREASAHFDKDWASRLWAASHGGVYVPISDKTPPNPFLKNVPERDIVTPSGRNLTLMNPAYMLRNKMEHYSDLYGIHGRITSLKHFSEATAPDEWEETCLLSFESGVREAVEVREMDGMPYFRLMKPLATEESCLKCHGNQGYKVGDIRGGISVSVPLTHYLASQREKTLAHGISIMVLWVMGVSGIAFAGVSLKRQAEERQKVSDLYTTVAEHSLTGIYVIQDGKIIFANKRFADIYGFSRQELIGRDSLDLAHTEDRPMIKERREKRFLGEDVPSEYESRGVKKNGEIVRIQARNALIDYRGKPAILGNVLDVTALREAESASKAYQLELEQKNRELDNFTSIASHDLREPLRKVQAFAGLLMSKCGQSLDDQGKDYLRRMQHAAGRMQTMIKALLALARVTTRGRPLEEINLNGVMEDALTDLEVRIGETNAVVEVDNLHGVMGDRSEMLQLFENLIGNALKFHRQGVPPHVRIYSKPVDEKKGSVEICVEDNGIGFDEKFLDRIFSPFDRLHGKEQYEGVGMGLAICMKITERHGGTITAKSAVGKGSVFIVSLPTN
jgi:two-component system, chemotaxis family, sensor kinase Cph1